MHKADSRNGQAELRRYAARGSGLLGAAFLFSVVVNLLMLTGPLFMLQVYDRVLSSRSEETLLALFGLVAFLYLMMGVLDYARGRVTGRVAARFQATLDRRIFDAVLRLESVRPGHEGAATGLRDLEIVQRFMGSPVLLAIFDMPWTPLFLAAIFVFHPYLGLLAVLGGGVLIVTALLNQWRTRHPALRAAGLTHRAEGIAAEMRVEAETVQSLGMRGASFDRWHDARGEALGWALAAADRAGAFTVTSKTLRLFLQSAMLALGAWLVLQADLSAGAMIASSIMMGRALAPVELVIGQWELMQRAARGWRNLGALMSEVPPMPRRTQLPTPRAVLDVQQLTVVPPGETQAALRMVSFAVAPGQAVGVIGPSGAGKSTLARALTGVWQGSGRGLVAQSGSMPRRSTNTIPTCWDSILDIFRSV
ncbi:MAG: ABC transporter transmembrane domain-containing protein [Marinobacter sp.]|jgi:ATP-binding cassette subfamily C protein